MKGKELALKLKEYRKHHGLTQYDIVELMNVPLATYRIWESGAGNPNEENSEKIAKILGE